jgi:hypothetical protein
LLLKSLLLLRVLTIFSSLVWMWIFNEWQFYSWKQKWLLRVFVSFPSLTWMLDSDGWQFYSWKQRWHWVTYGPRLWFIWFTIIHWKSWWLGE